MPTTEPVQNAPGIINGLKVIQHYSSELCPKKVATHPAKLFLLGVAAGGIIAFGAVAAATASHGVDNPGLARLISGLLFPFGLGIVLLMGTELFTGNTMIVVSVLDKRVTLLQMLKNWVLVYFGNMVGSVLVAMGMYYSGQYSFNGGALAVYTIKTAAAKSALAFGPALVLGILCNVLVCLGVLCSLTAADTTGRILGAYIPVVLFVIGGFEHCVANMYYIPAGLLALANPQYAGLAAAAGIDVSSLTMGGFAANLLPVTLGNIIGGAGIATLLWWGHRQKRN